jgi:hypothetical protein
MKLFFTVGIAAALASVPIVGDAGDIDTENLIAFAIGTDIGEVGEREAESETIGRFGKCTGSYTTGRQSL